MERRSISAWRDWMSYLRSAFVAASLLCAVSAHAEQLLRKGGEWRTTTTGVTPELQTMDMCFAPSTAEQAMAKFAAQPNCTKKDVKMNGNTATLDIACSTFTMQGTVTFSGDTAYSGNFTMQLGTGSNAKVFHSTSEAKWIGECKPGEHPL
jgi:Protein of unknown function (DUF3617)